MFADGSKATSKLNNEVERLTPLALTDRSDITVATDDQLPTQPWQVRRLPSSVKKYDCLKL